MSKKPLFIFGAGGASKEIYVLIKHINANKKDIKHEVIGFVENSESSIGMHVIDNCDVVASDGMFGEYIANYELVEVAVPIGEPNIRKKIVDRLFSYGNIQFPNFIHPSVIYDTSLLELGVGNIIAAGNVIGCNATLGDFNYINRSSTIGHDFDIGSYNTINPGCNISGNVKISSQSFVGTGSTILQNIEIGDNVIIGGGAVVIESVNNNMKKVGVPAKEIKYE